MSSDNIAISIQDIKKCFYVYNNPHDRLKQFVFPKLNQVFGREPNKYYKEFWALNGISFEVNKGETVGLIGKNGSGKSTLLQIICGTLTPTSGSIETRGRIAALLELGSGFNPEFTGLENIYLNAAILGLSKEETERKLDAIAAFADIGDFIRQPVKTYSSGMVVRLAFAVQAQVDPDILIVDEALAVGDAKFQAKCFDRLRQLKDNGTSILLVTHSGEQIVTHCDRAVLLSSGQKLYQGAPKVAVNKYMDILFGKSLPSAQSEESTTSIERKIDFKLNANETLSFESDKFKDKSNYNKNEYRWGDKAAAWLDYQVYAGDRLNSTTIYSGEKIKIRCSILFNRDVHNPIIGFAIKTKEGLTVYNTNSHLLNNEDTIKHGVAGSYSIVEFEFLNKLGAGDYFISLGIASMINNEVIPHDRRYDVIHFLVPTVDSFSGLADLDLTFDIKSLFGK
ncbi:ABC transporter ATP-binding protein [Klebsiella aerogenes]|uniref:ABC transporter ATP-binding protein n=1 Tax=Klebsiella aerogenes TaxID=548 RepID=UPI0005079BAB|nr:ABC transporter ATP-binding protein [Klebsiella aerogenes]EIV6644746.1 ABC transporter ATP-binding protein [Klebsiella aerogenes]EKT3980572.1 ABC transporter ATP-binding protein [Klebsiella aerogenes]ELA0148622.1 ABC transporter ATP-binding protein [Klebsiella aerogenes]KGB04990.1 ABC transporter family protein [Klebsiella aerogenes]KLE49901.1 sugar ABC transporter ATP-binding protein [Klebsiella aerogenes]